MAIHAASHFDVSVVGITISEAQARCRPSTGGRGGAGPDRVEIRLQDYRASEANSSTRSPRSACRSTSVTEPRPLLHDPAHAALRPEGRLLNHAISSVGGSKLGRPSFIGRYVFPDGELIDVGESVLAMERAGFEVRDVESLREHYATTLRSWVSNLEANWDDAVRLVGQRAGPSLAALHGRLRDRRSPTAIAVHQLLGVVPTEGGRSGMPPTRPRSRPKPGFKPRTLRPTLDTQSAWCSLAWASGPDACTRRVRGLPRRHRLLARRERATFADQVLGSTRTCASADATPLQCVALADESVTGKCSGSIIRCLEGLEAFDWLLAR